MRRFLALALAVAMIGIGLPTTAFAAQQVGQGTVGNNGTISGNAKDNGGAPLVGYTARCRNTASGAIAGTTQTGPAGAFSFSNLPAGSYIVEIVDSSGKIIATSASLTLSAGSMAITGAAVTAPAAGGAAAGGGSFFTSTTGILILAAAGGGTVAAILATRSDASGSK